jgi:hypothetical protein
MNGIELNPPDFQMILAGLEVYHAAQHLTNWVDLVGVGPDAMEVGVGVVLLVDMVGLMTTVTVKVRISKNNKNPNDTLHCQFRLSIEL